jgi:molybdenum cofactor synthesis domain-containing protein
LSLSQQPTVGVLIIGDEILKGVVEEANAAFFIKQFRALGSQLREVSFIPDEIDIIAHHVADFSERFDTVCTTGGIGPTHDDVTIAGVARAFDVEVVLQEGLVDRIKDVVGKDFNEGHRRLALLPEDAELVSGPGLKWPVLKVRNVFVFPGVPKLLHRKFKAIASHFEGKHYFSAAVTIRSRETEICAELDAIVAAHPKVMIGSYPRMEDDSWVSRLTVDGFDENDVLTAHQALDKAFQYCLLSVEPLRRSNEDPA